MDIVDEVPAHPEGIDSDPFGDAAEHTMHAIREAVAERRRDGLLLTVDRGNGVERIP